MTLYPYYYSTDFDSRSKKFIEDRRGPSGAFSSVYLKYYNTKNRNEKENVIFKLTDWDEDELFGLYFNFLIYKFYIYNQSLYPNSLRYLCKLHEFGEVQINNEGKKYYAYMDGCGKPLNEICKIIISLSIKLIKDILLQTLESLKLIHDLDYLHLDIKDPNFLFVSPSHHELYIKIIDFGMI